MSAAKNMPQENASMAHWQSRGNTLITCLNMQFVNYYAFLFVDDMQGVELWPLSVRAFCCSYATECARRG